MRRFQFGKVKELSNKGNLTVEVEKNIRDGRPDVPVRLRYEKRIKVKSQQEELTEYLKFSDELHRNPNMLDAAWMISHSKAGEREGYYFVVACWTELDEKTE